MDTSSINAQSIFDDNAATLKLSWLTGHEGWERGFSTETVANATSSADLVGHLNLIHPNRIQVLGDAEITYFGSDPSRYAERSSMQGLLATKIPLMVTAAELDPPRFVEQYELLKQASCKRSNGCARTFMLPQHSHISEVYAINTGDNRLTNEILEFVKTGK